MVYLIGAGPGDKELITVKGLNALKKADVVIYDSLIPHSLLSETNPGAQLIYVGKRAGCHSMKQEEINRLLVETAREGKTIARLKGGDPFIFGRGGEEALALRENEIVIEVIPGVSSSYGVAAYNGIPVTHRTYASSFHVITGHKDGTKGNAAIDYDTLAKVEGTLVFLMGLGNLPDITRQLMKKGKNPQTPAAVMQEGTTARQKTVMGTLETIADDVRKCGIKTPAVTVIGDVVSLRNTLDWYGGKPLAGKSVLITASEAVRKELSGRICELGGEPLELGLIRTVPFPLQTIEKQIQKIDSFTWIVFTSKNGVTVFFEQLRQMHIDVRKLHPLKFAALGKGTEAALNEKGIFCDCVPDVYSSRALGEALASLLTKQDKVLLLRAREASRELTERLKSAGIPYHDLPIYETVYDSRFAGELNRVLDRADYITFCSSSAVKAFVSLLDEGKTFHGKVVCIGPVTAKTAKDLGIPVYKEAEQYDIEGLIHCIVEEEEGRL